MRRVVRAENSAQAIGERARIVAANQRARDGAARATGEAYEAGAEAIEIIEADAAFALGGIDGSRISLDPEWAIVAQIPTLGCGQHPAQILIALAIGHEDVEAAVILERQVGADDRFHTGFLRGLVEARMTIDSIAIAHRNRGIAEFRRAIGKVLGRGGAFEEAECGAGAEFDVGRRSHRSKNICDAPPPRSQRARLSPTWRHEMSPCVLSQFAASQAQPRERKESRERRRGN